jgi:hypothetical protein
MRVTLIGHINGFLGSFFAQNIINNFSFYSVANRTLEREKKNTPWIRSSHLPPPIKILKLKIANARYVQHGESISSQILQNT